MVLRRSFTALRHDRQIAIVLKRSFTAFRMTDIALNKMLVWPGLRSGHTSTLLPFNTQCPHRASPLHPKRGFTLNNPRSGHALTLQFIFQMELHVHIPTASAVGNNDCKKWEYPYLSPRVTKSSQTMYVNNPVRVAHL